MNHFYIISYFLGIFTIDVMHDIPFLLNPSLQFNVNYYQTTIPNPIVNYLFPILIVLMIGSIVQQMIRNKTILSLFGFVLSLVGAGVYHMITQQVKADIFGSTGARNSPRLIELLEVVAKGHVALVFILSLLFVLLQLDLLLLDPKKEKLD
jgi:Na+/glutamate symporter